MTIKPKGRGGREAKRVNKQLREEDRRYDEGVLTRPEEVRERIQAEREAAALQPAADSDAVPLLLTQIRMDGGTQPRAVIDLGTIDEYAEAMRQGAYFPPVVVFYDGTDYWLADGFHRINAAGRAKLRTFRCDVRQGTRRDAVLFSCGANNDHGLRRTSADRRRAVLALLNDDEWGQWSDSEIGRRCHVHHSTVAKYRASSLANSASERTYTTKHGTTATMNTANIGHLQGDVIVRPAPPANLPHPVQDALDGGLLAVASAAPLSHALVGSDEKIANAALHYGLIDPQLIQLLDEKRETETVKEVLASGFLQYDSEGDSRNSPLSATTTALDLQRLLHYKEREHRRASREARDEQILAQVAGLPEDVFSVVYADCPWQYDNSGLYGAAEDHYPTLPVEDLWEIPEQIGLVTADNAALFLWSTAALLPDAIGVMGMWGFDYKTHFVWIKDKGTYGKLAFYLQTRHELLLLGTKGSFKPFYQPDSVIVTPKGGHSEKPALYGLIESMYPDQHYVELFAREVAERKDWTFWGAEAYASA